MAKDIKNIKMYDRLIEVGIIATLFFVPAGAVPRYLGQLILIIGWVWKCIDEKRFVVERSKYDLLWLLLFGWYATTGVMGFISWRQLVVGVSKPFEWLFAYYAIITFVRSKEKVKRLLFFVLLSGTITAVYSIYQHFFLHFDRTISFFSNPNILADYSEVIISMLFSSLLFDGSAIDFIKRLLVFVVNIAGWLYTLSMGSWMGVTVGVLFSLFMKPKKRVLLVFIVAVIGVSVVASPSMNKRFHTFWRTLKGEITPIDMERVYAWQSIMRMLKDRPIFGVGVENFDIAYPQYKMPKAHIYMLEAHNLYLHLAACTGWIGLGIFVLLWVLIFRDGVVLFNKTLDIDIKRWTLGFLMMWVVVNVHGMITYSFYDRQVATLIWSFLALLEVLGNIESGVEVENGMG